MNHVLSLASTVKNSCKEEKPRFLVIGLGGGCDVIAARAVAKKLRDLAPRATVLFGNAVGPRQMEHVSKLSSRLFRCEGDVAANRETAKSSGCYGSVILEQSLTLTGTDREEGLGKDTEEEKSKFFDERAHLLVFGTVETHRDSEKKKFIESLGDDAEKISYTEALRRTTMLNITGTARSLDKLNIDVVVGVDNGGDSLTGGIDFANNCRDARDVQSLVSFAAAPPPFIHLVFGPGCDGESSETQLQHAFDTLTMSHTAQNSEEGRGQKEPAPMQGWLDLNAEGILEEMKTTPCPKNDPTRTPAIIIAAAEGRLANLQTDADDVDRCEFKRHGQTRRLPQKWLGGGAVIRWPGLPFLAGFVRNHLPQPEGLDKADDPVANTLDQIAQGNGPG